jgi:phytoene dehydrogenase-like protein
MTIPSAVDTSIAPRGKHIVQLFVQYIPYNIDPSVGTWADPQLKEIVANRCFEIIEAYCPGFTSSILYKDILSPLDLEQIFGLHRGNIFHGSLSLNQIAFARPVPGYSDYRTPLQGLYLCGAGCHPGTCVLAYLYMMSLTMYTLGGGVMGAPGRNCAHTIMDDHISSVFKF